MSNSVATVTLYLQQLSGGAQKTNVLFRLVDFEGVVIHGVLEV